MTKKHIALFQEMLDKRYFSFWGETLNADWDGWLEKNDIKKMRYTEDGSGYSEIRMRYGVKVTENHITCFNRSASILSGEKYSLLLVPKNFADKALVLGGLP